MNSYKFFIFNIFFNLKFFYGFVFKVLNLVSYDNKNMNMLYMKKCQSLNKTINKNFLMDVVQLWNFFLLNTFIFFFQLVDTIFSNLTKNALNIFKLEKRFKISKIHYPKYDFWTKNNNKYFLQIISLHKLHFHVCCKEIY